MGLIINKKMGKCNSFLR